MGGYVRYPIYAPDECLYGVAYVLTLGLKEGRHKRNIGMRAMTRVHALMAWILIVIGTAMRSLHGADLSLDAAKRSPG
jgi:hypothetical protein